MTVKVTRKTFFLRFGSTRKHLQRNIVTKSKKLESFSHYQHLHAMLFVYFFILRISKVFDIQKLKTLNFESFVCLFIVFQLQGVKNVCFHRNSRKNENCYQLKSHISEVNYILLYFMVCRRICAKTDSVRFFIEMLSRVCQ